MIANWLPWIVLILLHSPLIPYFLFILAISIAALLPRRVARARSRTAAASDTDATFERVSAAHRSRSSWS